MAHALHQTGTQLEHKHNHLVKINVSNWHQHNTTSNKPAPVNWRLRRPPGHHGNTYVYTYWAPAEPVATGVPPTGCAQCQSQSEGKHIKLRCSIQARTHSYTNTGSYANLIQTKLNIKGLVQDCSNSIANTLELLQSCTKPSIIMMWHRQIGHNRCHTDLVFCINTCPTQERSTHAFLTFLDHSSSQVTGLKLVWSCLDYGLHLVVAGQLIWKSTHRGHEISLNI